MATSTGLLVKMSGDPHAALGAASSMNLLGESFKVRAAPLLPDIEGADMGFGAGAASKWWRIEVSNSAAPSAGPPDDARPLGERGNGAVWDACHSLLIDGFGAAGEVEFAEPDHEQQWLAPGPVVGGLPASCDPQPQRDDYPAGLSDFWYRSDGYGEYDLALELINNSDIAVRIAHLDTGYDAGHGALPAQLRLDLQRNFVDGERADDARDISEGFFTQLGHGTATMALLAGGGKNGVPLIGVAPSAEVIPIRVANRVVLFKTSAIARAFDYVHGLCRNPSTYVHVVTMSMGGLASQAWAEAVNRLYEAGVFIVTAAGNNHGNMPTRYVVFPARFKRVMAACGLMADNTPYANLPIDLMAGNYGPDHAMEDALAAYTPNTPWARIGCPNTIDHNGGGTSSATPQIAGAAALWIMKHRAGYDAYSEPWMRVEAIRRALFASADKGAVELPRDRFGRRAKAEDYVGNGVLRAAAALRKQPARKTQLKRSDEADGRFPIWRVITGFGIDEPLPVRQQMLELEATQLIQSSGLEVMLPDRPDEMTTRQRRVLFDALANHPGASSHLRREIAARTGANGRGTRGPTDGASAAPPARTAESAVQEMHRTLAARGQKVFSPPHRRLRVYAIDPSMVSQLDTLHLTEATIEIPWEGRGPAENGDPTETPRRPLERGPIGEYLEVIDVDPASRAAYAPVDLDHPYLLTQHGLAPSESNPQFHQQMVYAVAMRTIHFFERALGRVALWSPRITRNGKGSEFVRRLRIYPHALRQQNAFYSPDRKALLFGYFHNRQRSGTNVPQGLVFTALSHDIIVHETAHALLDGLHAHFVRPTNRDVFAFHEAFADILALLQHFTMPEAVRDQLARTRGDLTQRSLLTELAVQFGNAQGRGALRTAIGKYEKAADGTSTWRERSPSPDDYEADTEPHARGSVLVSAVMDAFLQVYELRAREFIELASAGSGILPEGKLPPNLVERLAKEAAKLAEYVLLICIRALDYCPPVDITFGEYLRAVVTADKDLNSEGDAHFRTALLSAFRARGINPEGVRHLSVDSVIWEPPPDILPVNKGKKLLNKLDLDWDLDRDRKEVFEQTLKNTEMMQSWFESGVLTPSDLSVLGFYPNGTRKTVGGIGGAVGRVTVHSVRPATRVLTGGQIRRDIIVEITQAWRADPPELGEYLGGSTLIVDPEAGKARFLIRKRVAHEARVPKQMAFESSAALANTRLNYGRTEAELKEPFRMLHDTYRGNHDGA